MLTASIILLTGERQIGKTTALSEAVRLLRGAGVAVTGLLTQRTGPHDLAVTELHTGASYPLTDPYREDHDSPTRNFTMNETALARSSGALLTCFPTQVFVLDEIGPLELPTSSRMGGDAGSAQVRILRSRHCGRQARAVGGCDRRVARYQLHSHSCGQGQPAVHGSRSIRHCDGSPLERAGDARGGV